jgi:hypothetical protein
MKMKLIRMGGFIPLKKAAEVEADLTDEEITSLLAKIQSSSTAPRIKDGHYWELIVGSRVSPVDIEKVPDEYKELFDKLKSTLKIVK